MIKLTVVLPVQVVYQGLYARLVEVTHVARRLSRLLTRHDGGRRNSSESVDDDFTSHGLDRVDNDSHRSRVELLEGLRFKMLISSWPLLQFFDS